MVENLSGVPPQVTLSGLSIGPGGLSGAVQPQAQGLSGTSYGATPFGLPGGADLLSLLLQQAQGAPSEPGAGGGILQGIGAGAFGQRPGGISAGSFGQTQPGYVAGQSSQGGAPGTSGSLDPVALLQKLLGLGKTGAQTLAGNQQSPTGTGSPTIGGTGTPETSLSDQLRSAVGVASPVIGGPGGVSDATGAPAGYTLTGGGFSGAEKPGINFLTNEPYPASIGQTLVNQLIGQAGNPATGYAPWTSLTDFSPEAIQGFLKSLEASAPGSASLDLIAGQGAGGLSGGGYQGSSVTPPSAVGEGGINFGGAASIFGALQNLLGLIQGARSDSAAGVGGAAQSALGLTQALNALATGTETGSAILAASPALQAVSQALSAASGPLAAAAPVIMAVIAALSNAEEMRARRGGFANNPIAGGLLSNATAGVGQANRLLGELGDYSQVGTPDLLRDITGATNALLPYYGTAQGPAGAVKASDAVTGMYGRPGLGGADQYTAQAQQAQQSLAGAIQEAMRRGLTYEQLGQLPVSGNWGLQTLNAGGTPQEYFGYNAGQYGQTAQPLLQRAQQAGRQVLGQQEADQMASQGLNPATFGFQQDPNTGVWSKSPYASLMTPENLLQAALGSSMSAPESVTHASGLASSMYGGPLWEALARMGGPAFGGAAGFTGPGGLIAQHFNPWATIQGFSPEQLRTSFDPLQQIALMQASQGT